MEIIFMEDNNLEIVGGAQESTKIIIEGMKDKFKIGVIQPGTLKKHIPNVKYYHITPHTRIKHFITNPFIFLKYILKIKRIINKENPKIIHTQAQVSFFIISLLRMFKMIPRGSKVIHTERGLFNKYNQFFKILFLFFMKNLNVLVTTTEYNMKYWKEAIEEKGLSMEFNIIENTAGSLFEFFNYSCIKQDKDKFVLGFSGRQCEWKNWPLAVEITKTLHEVLEDKLLIKMAVGCADSKALETTNNMYGELKKILGDKFQGVINVDLKEMDKFFYDLDAFILTSNYNSESFGRTLVEAMSRKTIVLTTDAGGSVEVVANKENVCNTAEDFVKRIMYFYNDVEAMNQEKEKNYKRVRKTYSLKNNLDKHSNLYQSILKKSEHTQMKNNRKSI